MFEKEAEENGFGIGCTVNSTTSWCKGAEYGYNKAKEEDKTLIEKRIADLEKENAELKDKLYLRETLLRMLVFWRKKNKKEFNAYFRKAEELFFEGVNYDV